MYKITSSKIKKKKYSLSIYLLLLSVLASPLRSYGLFDLGGFNVSFFRFFGVLMIISMLLSFLYYDTKIKIDYFSLNIIIILFYNVITLLYSSDTLNSHFLAMTVGFIWLFFAYMLVCERPDIIPKIIKVFIASSIYPICLGLYQWIYYSFFNSLPNTPFSMFLVSEGKSGITYNVYLRITSTFLDPSYYGMFLVIIGTISFGILINKENSRGYFTDKFIKICYVVFFVSTIAMLQTLSLTSVAGIASGIFILLATQKNKFNNFIKLLLVIVLIFILVILINLFFNYDLFEVINFKLSTQFNRYGLSFGRKAYFDLGFEKFSESPIFGVGFGGVSLNRGVVSSAHNTLLTILGQQGLLGFLLHMHILIYYPLLRIIRNKQNKHNFLALITFSGLIGIVVVSLGYDALYKIDSGYVVMLLVGTTVSRQSDILDSKT